MRPRHGLTLIEVLIAVTILAILAATCAPIIARSVQALRAQPTANLFNLAQHADAVLTDPADHGIDDWNAITTLTVMRSDDTAIDALSLSVLRSEDAQSDHVWVRIADGAGSAVYRWLHLPRDAEEDEP